MCNDVDDTNGTKICRSTGALAVGVCVGTASDTNDVADLSDFV